MQGRGDAGQKVDVTILDVRTVKNEISRLRGVIETQKRRENQYDGFGFGGGFQLSHNVSACSYNF